MKRDSAPIVFAVSILALSLVLVAPAAAEWSDGDDSDGAMHSLDSVDTGRTESLDSVDTGRTKSLDSVDTGHTESLDSVDTGRTESLDAVVERGYEHAAPLAPPASSQPFPAIENSNWEAQAKRAQQRIAADEERLRLANAAYSKMIQRDYPRGDARQKVIDERDGAVRALNEAWTYYSKIKRGARLAGRPL